MKTQPTGHESPNPQPPQAGSAQRLQTLQARVQRLEKELEGLQDALYRHEVLQDKSNAELLRRTEQIERHISREADKRSL